MSIEVLNESGDAADELALVALSRYVLDSMQVSPLVELCVRLVDVATMTELHEKWMDEPGPTDVLAFPMDELTTPHRGGPGGDGPESAPTLLGDVVLCPEVAERQARDAGHQAEDELHLLCTHGVLHLLGYDHHEPEEEREMFALQARLVAEWRDRRDVLLAALRPDDSAGPG